MATYNYVYPYIQHLSAWEVCKILSQRIYTQEAGAYYTKWIQLWCSATQFLC